MEWIVSITAGKWQRYSIQQARLAGFMVASVDDDPNAEGFLDSDLVLCMDIFDVDKIQEELSKRNINPSGVSSFTSEVGMKTAAALRSIYSLPGISKVDVDLFINKAAQRERWKLHNIPGPKWFTAASVDVFKKQLKNLKHPLIVKPVDCSGSRGITKLHGPKDDSTFAFEKAVNISASRCVIVEEFINGTEYTAEVFAENGSIDVLAITEKKKVKNTDDTVASELASPANNLGLLLKIKLAVQKACHSLNLKNGPGHVELIVTENQEIYFVEAAGRGGGFMVFDKLVPAISGVNVALVTALNACGKKVGNMLQNRVSPRNSAVLRFIPSRPGKVVAVQGFDLVSNEKNVEVGSFVKIGDIMTSATQDGNRMGFILTKAKTPKEAQKLADDFEKMITVEVA